MSKDYDLPTSPQQIRGKTEPRGLQTGISCNMRIVGELFKNAVEISGLPPQAGPDFSGLQDAEAQPGCKLPRYAMVRPYPI